MIPLSLYIHIPWCEKKCPYCDFNSHMARAAVNEDAYIAALLNDLDKDIARYQSALKDRKLQTIFIGGGTPSLFSASSIASILDGVKTRLECSPKMEVTLEANPGSAEADKFLGFRQAGVNRLSIGIQSFNPQHLLTLGRVHGSQEALDAAHYAIQADFNNFNLDLMFGLPEQNQEQAISDLKRAIELEPTHLSAYQLTIEPNTLFHHNPPITPDDEILWDIQKAIQNELAKADYRQYEVSAYAKPNRQCRHNINYWQFGDYLAIGAGAHGKLTYSNGQIERYWKIKHPNTYLKAASERTEFVGGRNTVQECDLPFEFMLNALRLSDGFELALYQQRTNLDRAGLTEQLDKHQTQGLIKLEQDHLSLTARGKAMLNSLLEDYLPD